MGRGKEEREGGKGEEERREERGKEREKEEEGRKGRKQEGRKLEGRKGGRETGCISYLFLLPGVHVTIQTNVTKAVLNSSYLNTENTFHYFLLLAGNGYDAEANRRMKATCQGDEKWQRSLVHVMMWNAAPSLNRLPRDFLLCEDYTPTLGYVTNAEFLLPAAELKHTYMDRIWKAASHQNSPRNWLLSSSFPASQLLHGLVSHGVFFS